MGALFGIWCMYFYVNTILLGIYNAYTQYIYIENMNRPTPM